MSNVVKCLTAASANYQETSAADVLDDFLPLLKVGCHLQRSIT